MYISLDQVPSLQSPQTISRRQDEVVDDISQSVAAISAGKTSPDEKLKGPLEGREVLGTINLEQHFVLRWYPSNRYFILRIKGSDYLLITPGDGILYIYKDNCRTLPNGYSPSYPFLSELFAHIVEEELRRLGNIE